MSIVLWNKLEGITGGIVPSQVGNNGNPVGSPTFSPAMFGNGEVISSAANNVNFGQVISNSVLNSAFTLSFYFIPNFGYTTTATKCLPSLEDSSTYWGFDVLWSFSEGGAVLGCFNVFIYAPYPTILAYNFTPPNFTSGSMHRIDISVDNLRGAGDRVRMYVDGVQLSLNSINGADASWNFTPTMNLFTQGEGWPFGGNHIIDDIIVQDVGQTSFPNWNKEGELAPTPKGFNNFFNRIEGMKACS